MISVASMAVPPATRGARTAALASALLGNGRLTGIRKHGVLGARVPSALLGPGGEAAAPLEVVDVAAALLALVGGCGAFREAYVGGCLGEAQLETLRFVEAAEGLRAASRSREQERALTLAAQLYRAHIIPPSRVFEGIGAATAPPATAEIWASNDLRSEAQLRSYAVLKEVLHAAAVRWNLLVLETFPFFSQDCDWDHLEHLVLDDDGGGDGDDGGGSGRWQRRRRRRRQRRRR